MSEVSFEREVLDRLTKIETKLDGFDSAKAKTYENEKAIIQLQNESREQEDRIKSLEESNKWIVRTTAAAVITAVVGIIFALVRSGAGL